ncbi:MAG: DUF4339 domain-containing protein [Planctomycetia bacterium]|jgi:hypothetical protein
MADEAGGAWHLAHGTEKSGPFTSQQLAEMGKQGRITSDMKVWKAGMEGWQSVAKVRGLQVTPVVVEPPPIPQQAAVTVAVTPAPSAPPMPVTGHVTIEKHSKQLKFHQVLAVSTIIAGIVMTFNGWAPDGTPTAAFGFGALANVMGIVWLAITKVRMWWHHG